MTSASNFSRLEESCLLAGRAGDRLIWVGTRGIDFREKGTESHTSLPKRASMLWTGGSAQNKGIECTFLRMRCACSQRTQLDRAKSGNPSDWVSSLQALSRPKGSVFFKSDRKRRPFDRKALADFRGEVPLGVIRSDCAFRHLSSFQKHGKVICESLFFAPSGISAFNSHCLL